MAQGYYTLEEAAKVLGTSPEKLNKMAQDARWLKDQKVNAFRDPKVVWRFRVQDIDALAGQGTSLGEAPAKGPSTPVGAKRTDESSVFDFWPKAPARRRKPPRAGRGGQTAMSISY